MQQIIKKAHGYKKNSTIAYSNNCSDTQGIKSSSKQVGARANRPPAIVDPDSSASKIIGIMTEKQVYDVFIPLANKIAIIKIRDLLSISDITSARPSVLGKIASIFILEKYPIGYSARIMSLYRLRALPIINANNDLVGQITAKRMVKAIHDLGADERVLTNVKVC